MLEDRIHSILQCGGGMQKAKEGTRAVVGEITELKAKKRLPSRLHL